MKNENLKIKFIQKLNNSNNNIDKKNPVISDKDNIDSQNNTEIISKQKKDRINEDKAKILNDFFKMNYYIDEGVIKHKTQDKIEKVKKNEEKVDSDEEEKLVTLMKDLEKEILPNSRIYFYNNEEMKFSNKTRNKKNYVKKIKIYEDSDFNSNFKSLDLKENEEINRKQKDIDDYYDNNIDETNEGNKEKEICLFI